MVYVIDDAGFAVTLPPVVWFNPVAGLQVYVFAPLAEIAPDCPAHNEILPAVIVGVGFTVTTLVAETVQPNALLPVTV